MYPLVLLSTSKHNNKYRVRYISRLYNIAEEKVLGSKLLPRIITYQFMLENKQTNITKE
jgi:hypothetical protein